MNGVDRSQAAEHSGVQEEFLQRLLDLELVTPDAAGTLSAGDLRRVRFLHSLHEGGIPIDAVATVVRNGELSFTFFDAPYWERFGGLTTKTLGEVSAETGISFELLQVIRESVGYARPNAEDRVREDEMGQIDLSRQSLAAGVDPAALERQIRVWGENLRRIAEADSRFFHEQFIAPLLKAGLTSSQVLEVASQSAEMMAPLLDQALLGMYHAQSEHTWMAGVIETVETVLERAGLYRSQAESPAMCFLDLTGYTRLTEERGDAEAARLASSLTGHVYRSVRPNGGRPVKWLGDGVMIFFDKPGGAVSAALEMIEEIPAAGLPPAHIRIDAGPVILQDGDYFGRTVNLAARIAARASAGEVLVSETVASSSADHAAFEDVGTFELKGIATPMRLHRARRAPL